METTRKGTAFNQGFSSVKFDFYLTFNTYKHYQSYEHPEHLFHSHYLYVPKLTESKQMPVPRNNMVCLASKCGSKYQVIIRIFFYYFYSKYGPDKFGGGIEYLDEINDVFIREIALKLFSLDYCQKLRSHLA